MDLSIIIVTWNSKDCIARCLQSLAGAVQGIETETIVVDNDSHDGTADAVRDRFPLVKFIRLSRNAGFAHACNVGLTHAQGGFVGFLNPDAEVLSRGCAHLVNFLKAHPRAAIAGGMLYNPDHSIQPSVHAFPTPLNAFAVAVKLHRVPLFSRFFRGGFESHDMPTQPRKVAYVKGAFFAARKSFLDEVGGFDEQYFLWFDEVDLQRSAHTRGWEVWFYPKAKAIHWGAQSFVKAGEWQNQRQFLKSMELYLRKWHGIWGALPVIVVSPLILAAYRIFKRPSSPHLS